MLTGTGLAIRFRRSQVMEELPLPEHGGDARQIYDFLNVPEDWRLLDLAALIHKLLLQQPASSPQKRRGGFVALRLNPSTLASPFPDALFPPESL
jgi:hypothetical protein